MEQVIEVNTQAQYDRVEKILIGEGYKAFVSNWFDWYKGHMYIRTHDDMTLHSGSADTGLFKAYKAQGFVVPYKKFVKYHAKKMIANNLQDSVADDQNDVVNHPNHYNSYSREVIDTMEGVMTDVEFKGYLKGNIIKYVSRYQFKNGAEDLKKAQWYLAKLRDTVESEF